MASNIHSSNSPHPYPVGGATGLNSSLPVEDPSFDIVSWYPAHQSCVRYFINHAQHGGLVQSVAAFINIRLPFQWTSNPITSVPINHAAGNTTPSSNYFPSAQYGMPQRSPTAHGPSHALPFISLIPYIRRLIVTGFDTDPIMHGFFGSDWQKGISPLQEIERRNYMFVTKSVGWAKVKDQYDMLPDETVPFMRPLQRVTLPEIEKSEKAWSDWLAMEDWMVGPRAPEGMDRPLTPSVANNRDEMIQDN